MVPLLDVLKETEMRLQFTEHFKSTGNREALAPEEVRKRLLLCLYATGTNLGIKRIAHGEHGVRALICVMSSASLSRKRHSLRRLAMSPMPSFG